MESGKMIEEKKPKKSPILLIALLGFFFILLSAGGVYGWKRLHPVLQEKEASDKDYAMEKSLGPIYPLDTIVVNLADRDVQKFIKVVIQLEMDTAKLKVELDERAPQIQDTIIGVLSLKTKNDLATFRGKTILRSEIRKRINSYLSTGSIKGVFFTDFITQ